jgi:alkanesulfonate monooxygenase SsuD/methylene tetrahydromethanopterin reductase-like flavin-dependent oxidoreductase (luciferase family)
MDGWHGVRFRKPVQTTRETIEIIRTVSRGDRLEHTGEIYPLPLPESRGPRCGLWCGPITYRSTWRRCGPKNLRLYGRRLAGQRLHPEAAKVFLGPLRLGAEHAGRSLDQLDLVAPVAVEFHDDQASADAAARRHADGYAFTIGAMGGGASGRKFYNDAFTRLGYGAEVNTVAALWQADKHDEARRSVPLDLGRLTNLLGTSDAIAERVHRYRAAGITTLLAKLEGDYQHQLATLERLVATVRAATIPTSG